MKILGTGSALPKLIVTNNMLSEILDTSDEWITSRTGIKERRILTDESLLSLAAQASIKAIVDSKIDINDLDYIICSNVVNNYVTPSLSSMLQGEIGAKCPCIDINCACSGFIYAMDMADSFFKSGKAKNILIVSAEEPSKMVDWKARDTSILFGDGAGAAVVTAGNNLKAMRLTTKCAVEPLYHHTKLEFNPFNKVQKEYAPLVMKGKEVFRLAVEASIKDVDFILKKAGLQPSDVQYYLLHQANTRIMESIREFLKESPDKFPKNIERYGNTSSATIPILLDEINRKGMLKRGDMLVFSSFGAGFSTGACAIEW